ncbi:GNAT family N-acetyltransferase [Massilia sp. ZL223]|uniref:GNAT family N-acetyltransferase n=1 Tax=Massilia sp. ZL223 TaxID=2824904 RepID=UPI001B81871D|nr:GNAT family N-acetyltransferase [Massilia sp. ZL223]
MNNPIANRDFPIEIDLRALPAELKEEFDFDVCRSTADLACPVLDDAWNRMLETGRSPEKFYQMPAFVRSRNSGQYLEKHWELVTVRRRSDAAVVGILPLRKGEQEVGLHLGSICLFKYKIKVLQLLGSVPLLHPVEERLFGFVLSKLLERHPDCQALSMQAVPLELIGEFRDVKGLSCHVLHGWRECHTVPLPDTVSEYLQKFSSKKRYNLSRQIRLLSKEAGEARLVRITQPDQVADLIAALKSLPSGQQHATPALQTELENSARNGLLLSYLLQCGSETVAAIIGSSGEKVWHVHNILCKDKYLELSVGTSITHLAMQDVIEDLSFKLVDFGYGTPNQEYRSTHVLKKRAQVLLCRSRSLFNAMFVIQNMLGALNKTMVERIKKTSKEFRRRAQKPGKP